ncbi:MAG: hypothetical protein IT423_20065, partial [Pirellulaceae bacterium]|nr:hypothetical protein [Pirellulaceae bacterium]
MSPPANQSSHASGDKPGEKPGEKPGDVAHVRAPQRRTLQSGFSLLARGEPKIWLTGGMLVICLTMIVSLLSLIIINGLATFWPGPVDWLVLSNNELDIGEPQRTEVRRNTSAMAEVNASEPNTSTNTAANTSPSTGAITAPSTPSVPVSQPLPSRFYRTANFDITNRHYRWFEPTELAAADIVRPPWALVIERQSWGRMYALASRLALPIRPTSSDQLSALQESETLITELASELETLAATGQPGADPTPEPNATPTPTPTSEPQPAGDASLVVKLTEAIARQLRLVRSDGLRSAIKGLAQDEADIVQLQTEASGPWQAATAQGPTQEATAQPVQAADEMFAARIVIDDPTEILERSKPVLAELAGMQDSIQHAMHKISRLDGQLSDARVAVRQAELDTGRAVLDKVDGLGPIMDSLTLHNRQAARIQAAKARAVGDLNDDGLA